MKSALILIFIYHLCFCHGQNFHLNIKIDNISCIKGNLNIAVYNNSKDFPEIGKEYTKYIIPVSDTVLSHQIQLESGTYAIALFHDINGDGICNRNILSIPLEPYGFSNNIHPKIRKPSFQRAGFVLSGSSTIAINLIQPKNKK